MNDLFSFYQFIENAYNIYILFIDLFTFNLHFLIFHFFHLSSLLVMCLDMPHIFDEHFVLHNVEYKVPIEHTLITIFYLYVSSVVQVKGHIKDGLTLYIKTYYYY